MLGRSLNREGGHRGREPLEGNTTAPSRAEIVYTRQERIATLAKQMPQRAIQSLNQYLDWKWLLEACNRTRKSGAVGVDGETWKEYEVGLYPRLDSLVDRAHKGTYRAPPVRRMHIPKGTGGETRPIGIPTFEDKVLQRAVVMLLEPIYEQDFHTGSYGFRPKRSAHQALDELRGWLNQRGGGWVLDVDIQKFFDTLDHGWLREFVQRRVRDGVVLRLIGKWLNAGVLEDGAVTHPDLGTPQGGVISPLLANIYLHYVLDEWFEQEVKPRLVGEAKLIRFADDFVLAFTSQRDAERVFAVLDQRFAKFSLKVHPKKTRLVRFVCPSARQPESETFSFLGFTLYWGRSRDRSWKVKTTTSPSRLRRAIGTIADWCRRNRHEPVPEQQAILTQKVRGHYQYYGRSGNYYALGRFYQAVRRAWKYWLGRRSWKAPFTWERFQRLLIRHPLPLPRICVGVSPIVRIPAPRSRMS
jgi:RNA-directed DNA polymerase